jgi:hypothetical protein
VSNIVDSRDDAAAAGACMAEVTDARHLLHDAPTAEVDGAES